MIKGYEYFENNIKFRAKSSITLAKYKEMQAFNLDEMIHGNHPFPKGVREIFLLKLDLWFRFLLTLEEQMIKLDKLLLADADVNLVKQTALMTSGKYSVIMEDEAYNDHFNEKIYGVWKEVHAPLFEYLLKIIDNVYGLEPITAFTKIGKELITILETTLFELFEITSFACRRDTDDAEGCSNCFGDSTGCINKLNEVKVPVVCFSDICNSYSGMFGVSLTSLRLDVYSKYFEFSKIGVRDYTEKGANPVCIKSLVAKLETNGVEIDLSESIPRRGH